MGWGDVDLGTFLKPTLGEKLCKALGVDARKAKRTIIVIDSNYRVTVTTEYD